jgi:propionyl-CoA carboxylase alpha chain
LGIVTVAVYSDADRLMPHVQMADEAYHIGPSPSGESYLVMEKILAAGKHASVDAIHPGYGFLSENASFAQRVDDAGFVFVGPSPDTIRAMGDKTGARKLARKANVPIVPGTPDAVSSEAEVRSFCGANGFPILIKAAAGGGGKGMRIVQSMGELTSSLAAARSEAAKAFGDDRVFVEKYLEGPRHIEFQILADHHGNTIHLGERECTIQRRHQKIIEESPSVILDDSLRARMGDTAVKIARACGYRNAGTIEFLVDRARNFYFLEMNTRLQVEHPITEMRTGLDLVAEQLRIAMGEPLSIRQDDIRFGGHAIECRICAEDVENDFLPSTGTIVHLKAPQGGGIREDRGFEEGNEVTVYYDPLLSKLIAWAPTRAEAIAKMMRGLHEYEILGVKTNIPAHRFILQHRLFLAGDVDTHFIAGHFDAGKLTKPSDEQKRVGAIACALFRYRKLPVTGAAAHASLPGTKNGSGVSGKGKGWKHNRVDGLRS